MSINLRDLHTDPRAPQTEEPKPDRVATLRAAAEIHASPCGDHRLAALLNALADRAKIHATPGAVGNQELWGWADVLNAAENLALHITGEKR